MAQADPSEVRLAQPSVVTPQELGYPADFLFGGPDEPRLSAATVATLRAFKAEPSGVPFFLAHSLFTSRAYQEPSIRSPSSLDSRPSRLSSSEGNRFRVD